MVEGRADHDGEEDDLAGGLEERQDIDGDNRPDRELCEERCRYGLMGRGLSCSKASFPNDSHRRANDDKTHGDDHGDTELLTTLMTMVMVMVMVMMTITMMMMMMMMMMTMTMTMTMTAMMVVEEVRRRRRCYCCCCC